jgi:hypothetical protein
MPRPESWKALLLFILILLLALHWVHLGADPPSRLALIAGQDRSADLYADEGLDSSGAIASVRYGHWYLPNQFNLAVDAPLWSAILAPVFHLTGVSLLVARSLQIGFFCASLWLFYLLLSDLEPDSKLLALLCLLVLSSNYLAFCFSRMAILESVWTFFFLASLLLAVRACRSQSLLLAFGAGLCLALAATTKLTAVSGLLPLCAIFFLLRSKREHWLRLPAITAAGAATLLLPYAFVVFAYFHKDHDYYRRVNILARAVHGPRGWMHSLKLILPAVRFYDIPLCVAFLLAALLSIRSLPELRKRPLFVILIFWLLGIFLVSLQVAYFPPRYLLNPLFPLTALTVYVAESVRQRSKALGGVLFALIAIAVVFGIGSIGRYLLRPQYTMRTAAEIISGTIPEVHAPRLMGDYAYTMAFYSKMQPFDDGFGVAPRRQRIQDEDPQLYLTLDPVSPDRLADFAAAGRRLSQVAVLDAIDNYLSGKRLYLYRVLPSQ